MNNLAAARRVFNLQPADFSTQYSALSEEPSAPNCASLYTFPRLKLALTSMNPEDDQLVSVLPIHFSNVLVPNLQFHQFPLLTRPLQVPPSAAASGKRIKARLKTDARRFEIHVPVDTRPEVWNAEKSKELGSARAEDDKEKNQEQVKSKQREGEEPRLTEVRLHSERAPQMGAYVLGIVRDGASILCYYSLTSSTRNYTGKLHLHPISETHQFRPTLTYMDILTRKTKRRGGGGSDDDSDDGPPPDPDEPAPAPAPKKEKKPSAEAKEVQVAIRKNADDRGMSFAGGLTAVRREMLTAIRTEEDERWEEYEYCASEVSFQFNSFRFV